MSPRARMSTECVSLSSFTGSSSVPIFFAGIPAAPSPRRELRASQLRADAEQSTQRWAFSFPSTFYIKKNFGFVALLNVQISQLVPMHPKQ